MATEELVDRYIKAFAESRGVDEETALKMITRCITDVSRNLKVPFSKVYEQFYEEEYQVFCLKKEFKCSTLDIESCKKSCHCIEFEGKCYSRYFENADIINLDPDKFVLGMPTIELEKLVKIASYLYYNFDGGGLTDNSYDALEYHLKKRLKLKNRLYEKIGAPVIDKIRAKLPYFMGSLKKVKPGTQELHSFLEKSRFSLVWSLKLDGVSGMITYDSNGEIQDIFTRGDGKIGGKITYLKDYITFPTFKNLPKEIRPKAIRGEFILPKKDWSKYSSTYSNPRNFVSAKINSGTITPGVEDLHFVVYDIMESSNTPSEIFEVLSQGENIEIVEHNEFYDSSDFPTVYDIISLYSSWRGTAPYVIDGLVLSSKSEKVAFKMQLEEQLRKTKVINIEWNISRYGRYVPVAIYESVYIDDVRLHRASAFNAAHVRNWNMGRGTHITIARSGDVIPYIVSVIVDTSIQPIFPPTPKEGGYAWHWGDHDIILDDIENNREVQIKRIVHFFETIGVPRLRDKTIEKLWDAGMKTLESYTKSTVADFRKIKGIGEKSALAHYENIHNTLQNTRVDRFIPASSTFESGIGKKIIKILLKHHPDILDKSQEEIMRVLKTDKIPGIGPARIKLISEGIPKLKTFLFSLNKKDIEIAIEREAKRKNIKSNPLIDGKSFVLSGFLHTNYELEDFIYDNNGDIPTKVTPEVEAVIVENITAVSKKMEEAHNLGIKVYSLHEFSEKYGFKGKLEPTVEEI